LHQRTRTLVVAFLAVTGVSQPGHAQILPALPPGTQVQVTTRTGERVIGPLAEVRIDSLYLSTTYRRPERAMAMSDIRRIAYQDGKVFHGRIGALIGIGAGLVTAQLAGRTVGAFRTQDGRNIMMLLGAGVGGFIGLAYGSPRWVVACGDVAQRPTGQGMPTLALRMRFQPSGARMRRQTDAGERRSGRHLRAAK
jgi:hypothetical protein